MNPDDEARVREIVAQMLDERDADFANDVIRVVETEARRKLATMKVTVKR